MKLLLFILAILFSATLLTLYAIDNPGYVLIARAPWSVEMSLVAFVPLLLATFFLFFLVLYILVRLWKIPRDVNRWRARRQTKQARTALVQGLTRLAEGNWVEAEAQLLAGMRHGDTPLLNYLGAAIACAGQESAEKRDEYLALAHKNAPEHNLAIGMTQAYLQHQAHQLEHCLATLTELRALAPKHRQMLKLLTQVYYELHDWTGLVDLIPDLRQNYALTTNEIDALETTAHQALLKLTLPSRSPGVLNRAWNAVPKTLRRQPTLIAIYARQLIQQEEMNEAESLLHSAIENKWDPALAELYGQVHAGNPLEQLETAEGWLSTHADDVALLLALARLAQRGGQENKARAFLEKYVALQGSAEAYRELGSLLERLGDKDKALNYYRRGLEMQTNEKRAATARGPGASASRARTPVKGIYKNS